MKKSPIILGFSILAVFLFCFSYSVAFLAGAEPQPGIISVSADDLKTAGFTEVKALAPTGTAFSEPVKYFKVKETVSRANSSWGAAANIVAVLVMPRHDQWLYNEGKLKTVEMAGRTQVRVSKSGYYIAVTGPDSLKTASLASILLSK